MSSGAFVVSKYETDSGEIMPIRIQPETAVTSIGSGANTAPSANVTIPFSARARGGKRKLGVTARTVTLRPVGTSPAGYKEGQLLIVPILKPALYNATKNGDSATYLGTPFLVVGKSPERAR